MIPSNTSVLLWSFRQGCFHIETLESTVRVGMRAYIQNQQNQDYIVVGVASTQEELVELARQLEEEHGKRTPSEPLHELR